MKPDEVQYCALEYRPSSWTEPSREVGPIIMLMLQHHDGSLQFLAPPNLWEIIEKPDRDFFEGLLPDFSVRAEFDPASLFAQAASLWLGVLVCAESGTTRTDSDLFAKLSHGFVPLSDLGAAPRRASSHPAGTRRQRKRSS